MMGNLFNKLLSVCFGEEAIDGFASRGTCEEREPLLTRSFLNTQISENRNELISVLEDKLSVVNGNIQSLSKEANDVKSTMECAKIEFDTSEEELRETLIKTIDTVENLESRIDNANSSIDILEERVKELEADDTTQKLRSLFAKKTPSPEPPELESDDCYFSEEEFKVS